PQAITEAYVSGKMDDQAKSALEDDIRKGLVKLPVSRGDMVGNIDRKTPITEQGIIEKPKQSTIGEKLIGAGEAALTVGTGIVGGTVGVIGGALRGV
ncbi:hypothetical protein ACI3PL_19635, partial [Lacticaseibacillus paracasei]